MVKYIKSLAFWFYLLSGILLSAILSVLILVFIVRTGTFGHIPDTSELSEIQPFNIEKTEIYSADDVLIGSLPSEKSTFLTLDEMSPYLIDALIAIEDIRFYDHGGIDNRALARVFIRTILLRQNSGGGSTLTQQLVKNLFPRVNGSGLSIFTDKIREMIIANRLEAVFTKEEILQLYLNTVSFGEDTYGIYSASYRFFNKHPRDLNLAESATLAGVLKATTYYNPYRNPEHSTIRRNIVLRQMQRYEMLTDELANETINDSLVTDYNRRFVDHLTTSYYNSYIHEQLVDITKNIPALDGNQYNVDTDGLIVHTTLNSRLQSAANNAVKIQLSRLQEIFDQEIASNPLFNESNDHDIISAWKTTGQYRSLLETGASEDELNRFLHAPVNKDLFSWDGYKQTEISPYDELRYYLSFLNAGFIVIDPSDGGILAWVGGIDHHHFQYDQVLAKRQPGSAFKPIVFAAALENGHKPCDYQRNQLTTYASYDDWTPRNHENEYGGYVSLQAALSQSINTATVHLAMDTGFSSIQQTAHSMGIQSNLQNNPSLSLGTSELSLLELTASYATFLNHGKPVRPKSITQIYNSDGELIYDFTEHSENDLELNENSGLSEETSAAMISMLEKSINEGTGSRLRSHFDIDHALAGKTGTTQNFVDGWFIGFTPEMVFGTRIGGFNHRVRFRKFEAYASQTAVPLVGEFLNLVASDETISQPSQTFFDHERQLTSDVSCPDFRDDGLRDRIRNFFRGRSSDDPVIIEGEI